MPTLAHLPDGVQRRETATCQRMRELLAASPAAMGVVCSALAVLVLLFHTSSSRCRFSARFRSPLVRARRIAVVCLWVVVRRIIGPLMLMGIVTKLDLLVEYVVMARNVHGMSRLDALIDDARSGPARSVMTTSRYDRCMLPVAAGSRPTRASAAADGHRGDRRLITCDGADLFVVPTVYMCWTTSHGTEADLLQGGGVEFTHHTASRSSAQDDRQAVGTVFHGWRASKAYASARQLAGFPVSAKCFRRVSCSEHPIDGRRDRLASLPLAKPPTV